MGDDRMQFTDLGSYRRIWRWMGECGDADQRAGEVLFSTPNMHWPGQVARPGDWIVRTPTGFAAEPARPDCICPDDPSDLEGPRCPVHEVEQLKAELSTTEAALAEAEEKLRDRYVAAMEAAQRIGDLEYENRALLTRISLAIGRIERGEPGAALTGLQAALVNAEMGDEQ